MVISHRTRLLTRPLIRLLSLILLTPVPHLTFAQNASPNCKALIQIQSDLWLGNADGKAQEQLTNDHTAKPAAAISADARWVAFNSELLPQGITLIDTKSGQRRVITIENQDAITDLQWLSPTMLRIKEHLSPTASVFHFIRDPFEEASSPKNHRRVTSYRGSSCTLSKRNQTPACIVGDAIFIKGRPIYYLASPFASASTLESFDLSEGNRVTSGLTPRISIEVKRILGHAVELKISTENRLWKTEHLRFGDTTPLQIAPELKPVGSTSLLGVHVTKANQKPGHIRLNLVEAPLGDIVFEGDLAWDPQGRRIAAIEVNELGQRTLLLVSRRRADNDQDAKSEEISAYLDGALPLTIDGPIRRLIFTSNTQLQVHGASQVLNLDVPPTGTSLTNAASKVTAAYPSTITAINGGSTATYPVLGWGCTPPAG